MTALRKARACVLCGLASALTACNIVASFNSLEGDGDAEVPDLQGRWKFRLPGGEERFLRVWTEEGLPGYWLRAEYDSDSTTLSLQPVRLGGDTWFNLVRQGEVFAAIPLSFQAKLGAYGDSLQLWVLRPEAVHARLEREPSLTPNLLEDGSVLLTGDSEQLTAFIRAASRDTSLLMEAWLWRVPDPKPRPSQE